ncbi:unnamed protein product [Blepharisma stoltei]|uniref:Uncharacterized protein n=1 Tax=Blepharisma stoltei TaxID=1481888 RepID=A0AAU9J7Z0_9CILI|nr:unnamed protein product [Blepharisma stoltei]
MIHLLSLRMQEKRVFSLLLVSLFWMADYEKTVYYFYLNCFPLQNYPCFHFSVVFEKKLSSNINLNL